MYSTVAVRTGIHIQILCSLEFGLMSITKTVKGTEDNTTRENCVKGKGVPDDRREGPNILRKSLSFGALIPHAVQTSRAQSGGH